MTEDLKNQEISVTKSSGNVFADLGLANPEELIIKAELARQIAKIITQQKMTQTEAAQILGLDQAKVSALIKGKLSGFSIERLFRFLNAFDCDVEIVVKNKQPLSPAQTKVCISLE